MNKLITLFRLRPMLPFYYPWKYQENLWFSDIFSGYIKKLRLEMIQSSAFINNCQQDLSHRVLYKGNWNCRDTGVGLTLKYSSILNTGLTNERNYLWLSSANNATNNVHVKMKTPKTPTKNKSDSELLIHEFLYGNENLC